MDIGWAVKALNNGERVTRPGWNGRGMLLELISASEPGDAWHPSAAYVVMRTVDGTYVPWTASQTDLLADDWRWV